MRYLESASTDPAFNLALEQYAFDKLSVDGELFMLWQNRDAVIVGLHQNTDEEIDRSYAERNGITVIRRLSGGGAVFHDLGNLNFTFITHKPDAGSLDFADCCRPIANALLSLGVPVEVSGRNDMTIGGAKFSGNASYYRERRLMHHGTMLFDTDFEKMSAVLRVPEDKIASKGIKSVRGRVTNIRDHLPRNMTLEAFWSHLRESIARDMPVYALSERDIEAVEAIRRERYGTWEWNYGRSPDYSIVKRRRIPGFGGIRLSMEVKNGKISAFATDGDYFGSKPYNDIAAALFGIRLARDALEAALLDIALDDYYSGLAKDGLISLILDNC